METNDTDDNNFEDADLFVGLIIIQTRKRRKY